MNKGVKITLWVLFILFIVRLIFGKEWGEKLKESITKNFKNEKE